ncbi:MAG: hypothetical protein K0T99_00580 [Alphaproteobacteria bacterium]|nr:hypothetical protein [Alphaproteobacteria bacterium]
MSEITHPCHEGTYYNPLTGHRCNIITKVNNHFLCFPEESQLENTAWIGGAATIFSIAIYLFNPRNKHTLLSYNAAMAVLMESDKLFHEQNVEVMNIPIKLIEEYTEFRVQSQDRWPQIAKDESLQKDLLTNFSHFEQYCTTHYHADICSPPPVLALSCHTNNSITGENNTIIDGV